MTKKIHTGSKFTEKDQPQQMRDMNTQKLRTAISKTQSAKELCNQLQELSKQTKWNKSIAEKFVSMIVNPERQYQLDVIQSQILINSIFDCPKEYQSLVNLLILSKNFVSPNGLRTLDSVKHEIIDFVKNELDLEPRIDRILLKSQGDQILFEWIKQMFKNMEENPSKKLDFARNIISYLIGAGDLIDISTRLDIILGAFVKSNYLYQHTENPISIDKTVSCRVKAITELFSSEKPSTNEAKRLILFGGYSQILAVQQMNEVIQLSESLQREKKICFEKNQEVVHLQTRCQILEDQLKESSKKLESATADLESEKELYDRLKASSATKISQQKNSAVNTIRNRIEHELQKLERCFNGNVDSFHENSEIGREIINDIRERLSD